MQLIDQVNPDVLYIGSGMPVRLSIILDQLNIRIFLPLEACLDFYTGYVQRGPL